MLRVVRRAMSVGAGFSDKDLEFKMTNVNDAVKNGSATELRQEVRAMVTDRKDTGATRDAYKELEFATSEITRLMKQYESRGGNMNVFNGKMEKIVRRLGVSTDPTLVEMSTHMGLLLADYIHEKSGTAASDAERAFYEAILPRLENTKDVNQGIMNSLNDIARAAIRIPIERQIQDPVMAKFLFPEVYQQTAPAGGGQYGGFFGEEFDQAFDDALSKYQQ